MNLSEVLPRTGSDAVMDRCAVGRRGPGLHGSTDGAEAEGVQSSGEHPFQDAAAERSTAVWIDDREPVLGSPLQVKVVIVRIYRTAPGDLQRGVGDPTKQERSRRLWS